MIIRQSRKGGEKEMRNRAQSTLEYAVVIAAVITALLAMNKYMQRGAQGRLREGVDRIGEQFSAGNMTAKYKITQQGDIKTVEKSGLQGEAYKQGATRYEVMTAAPTTRQTDGEPNEEKINKKFSEETLF
jgi:hypothetical protein